MDLDVGFHDCYFPYDFTFCVAKDAYAVCVCMLASPRGQYLHGNESAHRVISITAWGLTDMYAVLEGNEHFQTIKSEMVIYGCNNQSIYL